MTIVITDPGLSNQELETFQQTVLSAMAEICPATQLALDGSGTIVVQGKPGCDGYCGHRVGCNLLARVLAPNELGTLTLRNGKPRYFDATHHAQPLTLYWADDHGWDVNDLAHELAHACHDYDKRYQFPWKDEEFCTVCGENQVRAELGEPPRLIYYDQVVDCSNLGAYGNCEPLDGSDQRGCGCPAAEPAPPPDGGGGGAVVPAPPQDQPIVIDPNASVAWMCGCDANELESEGWTKLGDAYIPVGVGDMSLPLGIYIRASDGLGRVRLVSPCTTPCPEPRSAPRDFADCLEPFDRLIPGDGPVEELIAAANRARCRHPVRARLSELFETLFHASSQFILLERVSPLGPYGFMLLAVRDDGPILLTNLEYRPGATLYIGGEGSVLERRLPQSVRDDIVAAARRLVGSDESIGGDSGERDAATMFLTVRSDDEVRRAALLGYLYEGFDSAGDESWVLPDDVQVWREMGEVVRLWRRAMEATGPAGHPL